MKIRTRDVAGWLAIMGIGAFLGWAVATAVLAVQR